MRIQRPTFMAAAIALTFGGAGLAEAAPYNVTITNLTYAQTFSPPVVVSHKPDVSVATAGAAASSELIEVAENGNSGPLVTLLTGAAGVLDVAAAAGPVPPGGSVMLTVDVSGKDTLISAVGMLVATNDAFFFGDNIPVPVRGGLIVDADAWDAGSETNSELCSEIPAIPCEDGNPNNRNLTDTEDFVHVHRGIHGGGDLDPATHDWRNPVAMITITRAP